MRMMVLPSWFLCSNSRSGGRDRQSFAAWSRSAASRRADRRPRNRTAALGRAPCPR